MPDANALRYSNEIDLGVLNDAHSLGIMLTPPGSRVLDVGCATGDVASVLNDAGCHVWGIELDPAAATLARAHCEDVLVGDVENLRLTEHFESQSFDVVLFLDVLEHLVDPVGALRAISPLLAASGRVIASIPNVTHGALRLSLLRGNFEYGDTGLLDRTHLHLYDARAVDALFSEAQLDIVEKLRVTRGLTETEVDVDPDRFPPDVIRELLSDPEALTYQHVRVAAPRLSSSRRRSRPKSRTLAERLQERVIELEAMVRAGSEWAKGVEDEIRKKEAEIEATAAHIEALESTLQQAAERRVELEEVLRGRMAELKTAYGERRHLQLDLQVKDEYVSQLRSGMTTVSQRVDAMVHELEQRDAVINAQRGELDLLRYRVADRVNNGLLRIPFLHRALKSSARTSQRSRP